jgi:hypothetical protein
VTAPDELATNNAAVNGVAVGAGVGVEVARAVAVAVGVALGVGLAAGLDEPPPLLQAAAAIAVIQRHQIPSIRQAKFFGFFICRAMAIVAQHLSGV